jgi:hypothetical protein
MDAPTSSFAHRSLLAALGIAVLALLAAVVVAAGPAREVRSEYAWPPTELPEETPTTGWYSPLPLLNRVPFSLDLRVPCNLAPSLTSRGSATVLATARRPNDPAALRVLLARGELRIEIGQSELARLTWPSACPLAVRIEDGRLRLPDRAIRLETPALARMPIVTGLFTTLDLRSGSAPQVVVETRAYAMQQTRLQVVAAMLAVILACLALLLLARPNTRRTRPSLRSHLIHLRHSLDRTDATVVCVLIVWWVLAPTLFDDGWIWVENRAFADFGTASVYYDSWGESTPIGYWILWAGHSLVALSTDLVLARLPTLVFLLGAWAVCRYTATRVLDWPPCRGVQWTLAGAFLVGATAWGMTLRPEPFVGFLVLVSLAGMVSFVRAPGPAPLCVAVPAAVLAVTGHPAGIVGAAPLLAGLPAAVRWARAARLPALISVGTLLAAALAMLTIVLTLDSDLAARIEEARILREGTFHNEPFWREYVRYENFDTAGGATAVRHLSLALLVLSAVAGLTRRRASDADVSPLPARSVAIGLVLLSFVPSKWPWHFGTLAAIATVAVAAEVARLVGDRRRAGRWPIRLAVATPILVSVFVWSWSETGEWSRLDVQHTSWDGVFGERTAVLIALALIASALALLVRAGRSFAPRVALARLVLWAVPILSLAVLSGTIGVLVVDTARTSWSPARQNLEALGSGSSCGLAHQLRGGGDVGALIADPETATLLEPPVALYFPCARIPRIEEGLVEIPTIAVFQSTLWPLRERDGPFAAVADLYELRRTATGPKGVRVFFVIKRVPGFSRLDTQRRLATS